MAGLLVVVLGPPLFAAVPASLFGPAMELSVLVALQLLYCTLPALLIWIVVRWEGLPLSSVGLARPQFRSVAWGLLLLALLQVLPLITTPLLRLLGTEGVQAGLDELTRLPLWFRLIVGATGGVIEELLYRGYLIERLASLTGRRWLGATLAAIVFGVAHAPAWGLGFALGADLPFGIVMTLFYLWRRDLVANMIAHSTGLVIAMATIR